LRGLRLSLGRPEEQRAGVRSPLPLVLENPHRRLPALAIEAELVLAPAATPATESVARASYILRLGAGETREVFCSWTPAQRGAAAVPAARARTTYPFGFFEKTRTVSFASPRKVVVWPARIELGHSARTLLSRLGAAPTQRAGMGEDFFSLRPFTVGDDPRRVHWRRSAKSGQWFTKEHEAFASREVVLEMVLDRAAAAAATEHALASLGSLAEDLLAQGCAVGLVTAGTSLAPGGGARQRSGILTALALVDVHAKHGALTRAHGVARVGVLVRGAVAPAGVDELLEVDVTTAPGPSRERAA